MLYRRYVLMLFRCLTRNIKLTAVMITDQVLCAYNLFSAIHKVFSVIYKPAIGRSQSYIVLYRNNLKNYI